MLLTFRFSQSINFQSSSPQLIHINFLVNEIQLSLEITSIKIAMGHWVVNSC